MKTKIFHSRLFQGKRLAISIPCFIVIFLIFALPIDVLAIETISGQSLFIEHCSGCHINGGNIIRRGKTLKLAALKKRGLDNPEAIARVARNGIGSMSGYEEYLGKDGDKLLAEWIWAQAQNAWTQG